jgi:hypothetical protein
MASNKLFTLILFSLWGLTMPYCHAQIIIKQDPTAEFDKSKGIIALIPSARGLFYLNDYFLTEIKGNDTIFLINVKPGDYRVKFVTPDFSQQRTIPVNKRKVVEIIPGRDSIRFGNNRLKWFGTVDRIVGKPYYFLLKNHLYTILQFSVINNQWYKATSSDRFNWFNTATVITGYQVAPGFCIGLGLSYNNFDVPSVINEYGFSGQTFENASFLPVFMDLRVHLSDKRVAPFFNFAFGYSILLTKKSQDEVLYFYPYTARTIQLLAGGLHYSAGFGLRIAISKFVQIIPSLEYCRDKGKQISTSTIPGHPTTETTNFFYSNLIRFNIGIGLQYR